MPCPFFEPLTALKHGDQAAVRPPLLALYDGRCHAAGFPVAVPSEIRTRCCNHGNSKATCVHFPADEIRTATRYTVTGRSASTLDILCIEEQSYAPLFWRAARYSIETGDLETTITDACLLAQAGAFCRAYLGIVSIQDSLPEVLPN